MSHIVLHFAFESSHRELHLLCRCYHRVQRVYTSLLRYFLTGRRNRTNFNSVSSCIFLYGKLLKAARYFELWCADTSSLVRIYGKRWIEMVP